MYTTTRYSVTCMIVLSSRLQVSTEKFYLSFLVTEWITDLNFNSHLLLFISPTYSCAENYYLSFQSYSQWNSLLLLLVVSVLFLAK